MNNIYKLKGLVVKEAKLLDEADELPPLLLVFSEKDYLAIYNRRSYNENSLALLLGKKIIDVYDSEDSVNISEDKYISITFDDDSCLKIGMNDDDYEGPESLEFRLDNGKICEYWD